MRVTTTKVTGMLFVLFLVIVSSAFFFNRLPVKLTSAAADDQKLIINKTNVPDGNSMPSLADQIPNLPTNWSSPTNYYTGDTIAKFVVTGKPSSREFTINICMWFLSYSQEHCSNTWQLIQDGTYYIRLNASALWWTKLPDSWNPNQTPNDMGLVITDTATDKLAYYGCGSSCFSDPSVNIRTHLNFSIKSEIYLVKDGAVFTKPSTWADCPATVCSPDPVGIKVSDLPAGTSNQVAITGDGTLSVNPAYQQLDGYAPNKFMYNNDTEIGGYFNTCDNVTLTSTKAQYAHHFKVPVSGVYNIWFRMFAPDTTSDSFKFFGYLQNGEFRASCNLAWGNGKFPTGQWQWVSHANGLPGGGFPVYLQPNADIYFVYEEFEPGVKLDYMLLTKDTACKPTGELGSNCADAQRYSIHKTLGQGPPITATVPTLTTAPSPTITSNPSITATPGCALKTSGDANCDGKLSVTDFIIWKSEFLGKCSSTNLTATACGTDIDGNGSLMDADFTADNRVSVSDFTKWKSEFLKTRTPPIGGTLYTAHLAAEGTGSLATGNGSLSLSADEKSAVVTLTSTLDSSGQITAEHIHGPGALPDQFDLQLFPLTPGTQTINLSLMTAGQLNDLKTGKWYFNIHTFAFVAGEIRGTLLPAAAPLVGSAIGIIGSPVIHGTGLK